MSSPPDITLAASPYRLLRHRHAISYQSLDAILENSFSATLSRRPSTASTQTSFPTVFSSLEASPFRYYLPHISTSTTPVYTKNSTFACNLPSPKPGVQIHQVGRFYHYVPGENTETDEVYTDEYADIMTQAPRGKDDVQIQPEPKTLGHFQDFIFTDPPTSTRVRSPLLFVGSSDSPYRPVILVDEAVDVDTGSYTAGERLGTTTIVGDGEMRSQRNRLSKYQHRKSTSVADVSKKVKRMLRKLHLGMKVEK